MTRFALLLVLPLIAGCDIHANKDRDSGDKVAIHSDNSGNVSFDLPFAKGQLKLPEGFMNKGDVDIDGVKLMPGSHVTGFNLDSHNDVTNVDLSFTAPAPPDQVRAYFVEQFKKQGVEHHYLRIAGGEHGLPDVERRIVDDAYQQAAAFLRKRLGD